jgi:hypothetical protein
MRPADPETISIDPIVTIPGTTVSLNDVSITSTISGTSANAQSISIRTRSLVHSVLDSSTGSTSRSTSWSPTSISDISDFTDTLASFKF